MNFFEAIWSILMAISMMLTGFMDFGVPKSTSEVELIKEEKMLLEGAMFAGQGITTDGEYYYTSGSLVGIGLAGLAKWDVETFEQVAINKKAIPQKYIDAHDTDHIGGISYYDGKIYAAVENKSEDVNLVITYDCETLQPVDSYVVRTDLLVDGIPWCAVDADNGYLYCSPFNETDYIVACDLETMEFSHVIELSETVYRIQGGEVYDGVLYLSNDDKTGYDKILTVDIATGEVETLCSRELPSLAGNEAEGITICPMEDGTFLHVLDYDKTVGVYVRHYALTEAE